MPDPDSPIIPTLSPLLNDIFMSFNIYLFVDEYLKYTFLNLIVSIISLFAVFLLKFFLLRFSIL